MCRYRFILGVIEVKTQGLVNFTGRFPFSCSSVTCLSAIWFATFNSLKQNIFVRVVSLPQNDGVNSDKLHDIAVNVCRRLKVSDLQEYS